MSPAVGASKVIDISSSIIATPDTPGVLNPAYPMDKHAPNSALNPNTSQGVSSMANKGKGKQVPLGSSRVSPSGSLMRAVNEADDILDQLEVSANQSSGLGMPAVAKERMVIRGKVGRGQELTVREQQLVDENPEWFLGEGAREAASRKLTADHYGARVSQGAASHRSSFLQELKAAEFPSPRNLGLGRVSAGSQPQAVAEPDSLFA